MLVGHHHTLKVADFGLTRSVANDLVYHTRTTDVSCHLISLLVVLIVVVRVGLLEIARQRLACSPPGLAVLTPNEQ